ncbi:MAG TPA: DNA-directed DNA polymerase II small subunit [Thermoplasmata archaeon]
MRKGILKAFSEKGILIDPDAAELLSRSQNPMECVNIILRDHENRPLVLTRTDVENYLTCTPRRELVRPEDAASPVSTEVRRTPPPEDGIRILRDITGNSTCVGNVIDFAKLFNDRYSVIKKILSRRRELSGLVPISMAKRMQRDVKFVGIVNEARMTKNGHTIVDLEDDDGTIQVLVMKNSRKGMDSFIKDEILGVVGSMSKDGELLVAKDVIRPDVPINSGMVPNGSGSVVAFVSDIHVGSTEFLHDEWNNFVGWLNRDPTAKDIKYIVMPGDLVDGIGIYPGQEDELLIEDVYAQYAELARLVKGIPQRIKIVMMPGNHDAVRLAEPQPALSKDITSMFDPMITFVGNPCYLEIEGRRILAYHGRSMDDLKANIRNLSYEDPGGIMIEMLKRRHMAPIYGERTALAPEQKDYLVIDDVPEIFVTGHIHGCRVDEYRGIKLINASAWQSQTSYQRMHNQVPDPAKVPMTNLGTGETWIEDFSS